MAAASLRQTKITVLLSLNAAAILIAGILVAGAIWLNGGMDFRAVAAWMNSEDHRKNILNPNYTKLSVGFYFDPTTKYHTH